jgi:hypothetical protein
MNILYIEILKFMSITESYRYWDLNYSLSHHETARVELRYDDGNVHRPDYKSGYWTFEFDFDRNTIIINDKTFESLKRICECHVGNMDDYDLRDEILIFFNALFGIEFEFAGLFSDFN